MAMTNPALGLVRDPGETYDSWNRRCSRARLRLRRAARTPEEVEADRIAWREWRLANIEQEKARNAAYVAAHLEKTKDRQKKYRAANLAWCVARNRAWLAANPGKASAYMKAARKRLPELFAAHAGVRAKRLKRQMPPWADRAAIKTIYIEAKRRTIETGIMHHVDHEIPLKGRQVSGLHVEGNLRIIPATENLRKYNRMQGDDSDLG